MEKRIQAFVLILTLFMLVIVLVQNNHKLSLEFDSSFNLNVVKNFVSNGIYGTSVYLVDGQKYYWFDPWITTGPSVLIPTSFLALLFRDYIFAPRYIMNLYLIAFFVLFALIIRLMFKDSNWKTNLIVNIVIAFIFTAINSNIIALGVHTLGEIPGYAYLFTSILLLHKKKYLGSGIMLGLTLLAKLQFIFFVAPLMVNIMFQLKNSRKSLFSFILGFLIPVATYLLALLLVYGKDIRTYYGDFKGVSIMQKAMPSIEELFRFYPRIQQWFNYDKIFFILTLFFLVAIILFIRKKTTQGNIYVLPSLISTLYLIFIWQFNSPRHILVIKYVFIVFFVQFVLIKLTHKMCIAVYVVLTLAGVFTYKNAFANARVLNQQIWSAKYLNAKYPKATFYNVGWWKSPELGLLMDREIIRLDKLNLKKCYKECYLLVSLYQTLDDPGSKKDIDKYKSVERNLYFSIYKIK